MDQPPVVAEAVNQLSMLSLFKLLFMDLCFAAIIELVFGGFVAPMDLPASFADWRGEPCFVCVVIGLLLAQLIASAHGALDKKPSFLGSQNAGMASNNRLVLFEPRNRHQIHAHFPASTVKVDGSAVILAHAITAALMSFLLQSLETDPFHMVIFAITQAPGAAVVSFIASTSTIYPTSCDLEGAVRIWIATSILASDQPKRLLTYEQRDHQQARRSCINILSQIPACFPKFASALILHPGNAWRKPMLHYQERMARTAKHPGSKTVVNQMVQTRPTVPCIENHPDAIQSPSSPTNMSLHDIYLTVVIPAVPTCESINKPAAATLRNVSSKEQQALFTQDLESTRPPTKGQLSDRRKKIVKVVDTTRKNTSGVSVTTDAKSMPKETSTVRVLRTSQTARNPISLSSPSLASTSITSSSSSVSDSATSEGSVTFPSFTIAAPPQTASSMTPTSRGRKRSVAEIDDDEEPDILLDAGGDVLMDEYKEPDVIPSPEKKYRLSCGKAVPSSSSVSPPNSPVKLRPSFCWEIAHSPLSWGGCGQQSHGQPLWGIVRF
ncbi:uncharacterized protein EI97DRAFT_505080 [Westerdykella ornata]|uniref:Uncharacterized protein n=1 Tax=Westerdykella ornata TaxID=318751 RepID=A0A6A6J4D9_WESOR|nr:uncharacterized protein EI97DRAFT_505080 [Westerdykella ornata]KAF2271305.1 hypothetical protein EI97DRAFT_505080 [Westerdykella ornata]